MLSSWPRLRAPLVLLVQGAPVPVLPELVLLPERVPLLAEVLSLVVLVSLVWLRASRLRQVSPWRPRATVAATARKAGAVSEAMEGRPWPPFFISCRIGAGAVGVMSVWADRHTPALSILSIHWA